MRVLAIVVIILAIIASQAAVNNVFVDRANRPADSATLAGYVVGSFLVPLVLFFLGLVLWNRSKGR